MLAVCQLDEVTKQVVSCVEYTNPFIPQLTLTEATMLGLSYWLLLAIAFGVQALKRPL